MNDGRTEPSRAGQVRLRPLSGADRDAVVRAPVVDQSCRRAGIARALMAEAERWGQKHGCRSVVLSSNVVRDPAHAFYRTLGYRVSATAHVFRKPISERVSRR